MFVDWRKDIDTVTPLSILQEGLKGNSWTKKRIFMRFESLCMLYYERLEGYRLKTFSEEVLTAAHYGT
jgi:hypothetical protein